ncbi:MAG TPA: GHKL domain-containing protein [Oscillospiraceae bacterium]|nr:GHKL domain-containing protein [Oscillospiraceae bacterium]
MYDRAIQIVGILLSCFAANYVIFDFLNKKHERVFQRERIYVFAYFAFSIVLSAVNFANNPLLNFLTAMIFVGVIGYFLYTDGPIGLLCNELFTLCLALCEVISATAVSLVYMHFFPSDLKSPYYQFLIDVVALIIIITVYHIFIILLNKIHIKMLSRLQYLFFLLFPVFSIVNIFTLMAFSVQTPMAVALILVTVIITIGLNLFIAYLFEFISKSNELENQLNLFQQQASIQYDYYNNLEKEYQQMRKMRHDVRNHLQMLEKLYQSNEKQMADQYAKNIYEMMDTLRQKKYCDNTMLNIIMNDKTRIAELNQIQFDCNIGNINVDFIAPIDLTTIFANLLDNAVEGCKKLDGNRFIKLLAEPFHDFININISNSFSGDVVKKGDRYLSTKAAHEGIGIPNVIQKVEKYGGNLMIHTDQNVFTVNIVIPVIKDDF